MLSKKSSIVFFLTLFTLILTAWSQQTAQTPTIKPDLAEAADGAGGVCYASIAGVPPLSSPHHTPGMIPIEQGIIEDNLFVSLKTTNIYTYSIYLPLILSNGADTSPTPTVSYPIVDTGQTNCYDEQGTISCPQSTASFYGQDANYVGLQPSYIDNGDGTVTDLNTGLMWQQTPNLDLKSTYNEAVAGASTLNLAAYNDWRLPTIKELYSLIDFNGHALGSAAQSTPFIDPNYFDFEYGDTNAGERLIDAQYWSSTEYVGTTMNGDATVFGVNFADGRIKGYPSDTGAGGASTQFVRYVRDNPDYGINSFVDNGNGTISDQATGLMWQQADSGTTYNWDSALSYCEALSQAGYDDWRLPNAKELHSIVDYTRAPDAQTSAQQSAAIDPIFNITSEDSFFWSGTTHLDGPNYWAVYIAFGQAWGYMELPPDSGSYTLLNVHGAGAQRSDPKSGDPANWPNGNGPQGDIVRIYNYARCVRDDENSGSANTSELNLFAPLGSTNTYLMDNDGNIVYTWASNYPPGNSVYLLENGNLLHTGNTRSENFETGGAGGIVQEITLDGTVVWTYEYDTPQARLHHDVEPLPNGNVLMIAWELKTEAEAIAAGRNPGLIQDGELWPDHIIEIDQNGAIVWDWHLWDHLIQDYDNTKSNYGLVANHPELIDLNFSSSGPSGASDWNHTNSIDYNEEFDQILLSVRNLSEIWVIDHSATSSEAAGHSGGNSGQGGDLLYRWGNPQAYDAGSATDQQLFVQHDAQWIPSGYPGAGNILVFNNGMGRSGGNYSSVDEIVPPVDASGNYALTAGAAYGPSAPTWSYTAATPTDFYATNISGAQRLSNGNTLICDGPTGIFFEVTLAQEIIWEHDYDGAVFRITRYASDYPGLPD